MLCRVLIEENYNVIQTSNLEEALKRLNDAQIDLILLDLTLPPNSGHVFELIRKKTSLPLILISSGYNQPLKRLDSQNEAWMEKPLDLFRLLRTIEELLEEPLKSAVACRVAR
jgi:DNA-binding response OmpR family regulator